MGCIHLCHRMYVMGCMPWDVCLRMYAAGVCCTMYSLEYMMLDMCRGMYAMVYVCRTLCDMGCMCLEVWRGILLILEGSISDQCIVRTVCGYFDA